MAIWKLGRGLDPFPALGADGIGVALQLLGDHARQQPDILQPAAIILLEQIAHDGATRRHILLARILRPLVAGAHRPFRQHPADLIGLLVIGTLDRLPYLLLALMVGADREGHQLVERHLILGIDLQQPGRHGGQPQPLLHHRDRDKKHRRDLLLALPLLPQRLERPELIQRMQRRALHILRQAVLLGDALGADNARDRRGLGEALLPHQQFQRPVAPPAGGDFEHAGLGTFIIQHRAHGDALQQRAPRDIRRQLLDRDAGLHPPDIRLREHEPVKRNIARGAERDLLNSFGHGKNSMTGGQEPLS